jgi:hypothetical protein
MARTLLSKNESSFYVSTPRLKAESLFLASTAILHTFAGVQLWLLLPKHPSPKALGQRTNAPLPPNLVGR